jgi:ParB/RepB/Spo0J family partition protein
VKIQRKDPRDLKPYENNARFNDHAVDDVAKSIEQFGFQQPIVVDRDNVIIAGHTRWKAACKLGLTEVPVSVADKLTPAQVAAYRLADNKVAEKSKWDKKKLPDEIKLLEELNFKNIEDIGFTTDELQRLTVNNIIEEINAEPEYIEQDDTAERRYKKLVERLSSIKNKHPEKLKSCKLIFLSTEHHSFICIVDETLKDFITEVERNKEFGNHTILDEVLNKVYPL